MALANFLLYTCSVLLLSFTSAALLDTRQAGSANVEEYLVQVRSVLLAIDAIRSTGASESCADVGFAGTVDAQGLDDQLAQTIVCEVAAGIDIFPDLERAEQEFSVALEGLTRVSGQFSDTGEQSFCRDDDFNVDALDNAGLDGSAIRDIICSQSAPSPTSSPLDPVSITATLSLAGSTSSTTPATTLSGSAASGQPSSRQQSTSSTSQSSSPTSSLSTARSPALGTFFSVSPPFSPTSASFRSTLRAGSSSVRPTSRTTSSPTTSSTSSSSLSSPTPTSTSASTSSTNNITVVVVTTFVTLTVTPTPSPATNGDANDNPTLPPLRFTLASRVIPEDPAVMASEMSELPTWTIGPPLSLPDPRLADGQVDSMRSSG